MTAKIWWVAGGTSGAGVRHVEELDLGRGLTRLGEPDLDELASSAESLDGQVSTVALRRRTRVTFYFEDETSLPIWRGLRALVNHLRLGGHCAIALDSLDTVFGHLINPLFQTQTSAEFDPSWLRQVWLPNTLATPASVTQVVLRTPSPEYREEICPASNLTHAFSHTVTLSTGPRAAFPIGSIIRSEGFYPLLKLAPEDRDKQFITSDHRISYDLELPLVEDLLVERSTVPTVAEYPSAKQVIELALGGE